MQSNNAAYKNAFMSIFHIIKNEKIFGLFKGIIPPVLNQFPCNAM